MQWKNYFYNVVFYREEKGYPDLGKYQHAYHIVREADLLSAYDFDRCMIYSIAKKHENVEEAYNNARDLFYNRILKYDGDQLLLSEYSRNASKKLYTNAIRRMTVWKNITHGLIYTISY